MSIVSFFVLSLILSFSGQTKSECVFVEPVHTGPDTIFFRNPSFDGKPGESMLPKEWTSQTKGSTPDIFPGAWKLQKTPHHGNTCLGLVVREDNTSEDITQELNTPLLSGECYEFQVWLSTLPKYVGYDHACQLRIYGGDSNGKEELLDASALVSNQDWQQFKFQFTPKRRIKFLSFVAWYGPGVMFKYKGNILMDDLSPIIHCDRA
jgi:hypothetical protein